MKYLEHAIDSHCISNHHQTSRFACRLVEPTIAEELTSGSSVNTVHHPNSETCVIVKQICLYGSFPIFSLYVSLGVIKFLCLTFNHEMLDDNARNPL